MHESKVFRAPDYKSEVRFTEFQIADPYGNSIKAVYLGQQKLYGDDWKCILKLRIDTT